MTNKKLNVLVLGGGGREHALYLAVKRSPQADRVWIAPGNGGIDPEDILDVNMGDFPAVGEAVSRHNIGLVIVGPEQPLVDGLVDFLTERNIPAFGPDAWCAQIEGSKNFAKEIMSEADVPTAAYSYFEEYDQAKDWLDKRNEGSIVVKADGLAAGKGVTVAASKEEAARALKEIFVDQAFGEQNKKVVMEEFLTGQECSLFALCDGETALPLIPAQDHKQVGEGDTGPNTGGMGAYCPAPVLDAADVAWAKRKVFQPILDVCRQKGHPYKGVLYAGFMVDKSIDAEGLSEDDRRARQIRVLEFNCRFGDPETQIVLPALKGDWLDLFMRSVEGRLDSAQAAWESDCLITVVLAAPGYPGSYEKGIPLSLGAAEHAEHIIHAGTARKDGALVSSGGRVLNVLGRGKDIDEARKSAYGLIDSLNLADALFCRRDIGRRPGMEQQS
jgi:phosphoribosylamine--glycine ligase